jgi:4-amino-4-deoxy-L-arabinose transferase-like glycosyltransferase
MTENFTPSYRHIALAVLIVLMAFGLRVVLVFDRAAHDGRFYPPPLSDSDTYFQMGKGILAGTYPYKPYDYQPGAAYAYALLMGATGQPSIPMLRIALSLVDAIGVGFLIGAGWLLSNRASGGYFAGLSMALYPVSIYYGTVLLLEPLAAFLLCVFLYFLLWQKRELALWRTVILGLVTGYLVATRINLAPVALFGWIYLLAQRPGVKAIVQHTAALVITTALVIAPFTLWNIYSGGKFQLMQTGGMWQLYIGTNRDGDGTWGRSAAFDAEDVPGADEDNFRAAILRDIQVNPPRFIGLMLRKLAIFWSDAEPGNGDDFYEVWALSPLFRSLPPLFFPYLALAGLIGLVLLWYADRKMALFLAALILLVMVSNLVYFAISRFRYPVVIPLHLLAGYAAAWLWAAARAGFKPAPTIHAELENPGLSSSTGHNAPPASLAGEAGRGLLRYGLPIIGIVALLIFPSWALTGNPPPLPPKTIYADLPADALPVHVTFGDVLTLRGWRYQPYTRWWDAADKGWTTADGVYTVELFWSLNAPVTDAYQFFINYVDNDVRYGALDRAVGTVSYPPKPTDRWQVGEIYGELVSFHISDDAPRARSGRIMVGAYRLEGNSPDGALLPLVITDPPDLDSLTLQRLAIYDGEPDIDLAEPLQMFGSVQQDAISLFDFELPSEVQAGATVVLHFDWQALSEIRRDYNVFIHIADAAGNLVAQGDAPVNAALFTSNWQPGYRVAGDYSVTMPTTPGTYDVYIGLVDAFTGERLSVNAPDNRPLIGEILVK